MKVIDTGWVKLSLGKDPKVSRGATRNRKLKSGNQWRESSCHMHNKNSTEKPTLYDEKLDKWKKYKVETKFWKLKSEDCVCLLNYDANILN